MLLKAINASATGIIITNNLQPDNPIIFCNDKFLQMTGYDRSEMIKRNCRFLQGEDRAQEARWILKDAVLKGSPVCVELRNYRKDGSLFWNELYMSPVKNSSGEVTHFIGVQNDITRRKNAEERLKTTQDNFKFRY